MNINNLIDEAAKLARKAHRGQWRADGQPYETHLAAVASLVGYDSRAVVVAWLHDLIEDHPSYLDELKANFPEWVVDAVLALSHAADESYLNYLRRVMTNPLAVRVKLADLTHNLSDQKLGSLCSSPRPQ